MTSTSTQLLWTQPQWIDQAQAWIRQALADAGYTLTAPVEQFHVQIWSTVMRCTTQAGTFYFKASYRPTEVLLTQHLRRFQPENLPDVLALDGERGWMLMRDSGAMLRTYLKSPADLHLIEPALVQFASLQIAASDHPEQFFPLGVADRRLERLPDMFSALLSEAEVLRLGYEDGLSAEEHERLRSLLPRYREMCSQLQDYHIPQTLHHDDFHDGNIFVSGEPGRYRFVFSDWEECLVTHPFFSMMLCLRSVGGRAGFPDEATEAPEKMPAELNHLRDVYLEPWRRFESRERLVEAFNLAWRVGMVSRALTWREFIVNLEDPQRERYAYIVLAWLQEFLLAMKDGAA